MVSTIRVGVIGVDYGARVHIPALQSEEAFEVIALCSRREEKAREAAERFEVGMVFTDFRELAQSADVDMVVVVGPAHLHYPMVMAALEADKHVLCEKPFTTRLEDAAELRDEAVKRGVTAMLGHEFRYSSGRAYAKDLIDDGYIGDLRIARAWLISGSRLGRQGSKYNPWSDDAELGGGLLWSQGSHYIDCLMHWFGEVESASGQLYTHIPERRRDDGSTVLIDGDDAFEATLSFVKGGSAHVSMSYVSPFGVGGGFELYGTDGTLFTPQAANSPNPPAQGAVLGGKLTDSELRSLPVPPHLEQIHDDRDMRLAPTRRLLREFLHGIESGTSPSPNFESGYRLQCVLHAIRRSSLDGRVIRLAEE